MQYCKYEEYKEIDLNNIPFDIIHKKYYECVEILYKKLY